MLLLIEMIGSLLICFCKNLPERILCFALWPLRVYKNNDIQKLGVDYTTTQDVNNIKQIVFTKNLKVSGPKEAPPVAADFKKEKPKESLNHLFTKISQKVLLNSLTFKSITRIEKLYINLFK